MPRIKVGRSSKISLGVEVKPRSKKEYFLEEVFRLMENTAQRQFDNYSITGTEPVAGSTVSIESVARTAELERMGAELEQMVGAELERVYSFGDHTRERRPQEGWPRGGSVEPDPPSISPSPAGVGKSIGFEDYSGTNTTKTAARFPYITPVKNTIWDGLAGMSYILKNMVKNSTERVKSLNLGGFYGKLRRIKTK